MDNLKVMREYRLSFVKNTANSEEPRQPSARVLPALSTRSSLSQPLSFCGEPNHCFEDDWIVKWDPNSFYCVFEYLDYLRYYSRLSCAIKKGTEVFQSESQREPQVSPGDVDNNKLKSTEEPDQTSPNLLREKGLELETCDGGDCPDQNPASDSPRSLGCWAWLQRAFGQKKKK